MEKLPYLELRLQTCSVCGSDAEQAIAGFRELEPHEVGWWCKVCRHGFKIDPHTDWFASFRELIAEYQCIRRKALGLSGLRKARAKGLLTRKQYLQQKAVLEMEIGEF